MEDKKEPNRPLREWKVKNLTDAKKDEILRWACKKLRDDITDACGVGCRPQVYDSYDLTAWLMDRIIYELDDDIRKYTDKVNEGTDNIYGPGAYMDPDAIALARWYLFMAYYSTHEGQKAEPGVYKDENLQG